MYSLAGESNDVAELWGKMYFLGIKVSRLSGQTADIMLTETKQVYK